MSQEVERSHPHAYPPIENADRNRTRSESKWPLIFAAMTANFGGWVMGTAIGWTGPELHLLINDGNLTYEDDYNNNHAFPVTESDGNLIASLYPIGALVGGLVGGTLTGKMGRKFGMYVITVFFAIGYLFLAAAFNKWMLFIGRLLCGFGTGITTIAVPVYVSETASADVRGMLGSFFQVMVTIGVLYVDIVGAFLSWRWISVACLGLVFIWSVLLLYIPESPAFLLSQRDFDGARESMQTLRGHPYIESELAEIQETIDRNIGRKVTIRDLGKPQNLKPLLISLMLMLGQQLSGINAVIFYSVSIFEAAKTTLDSFVETIIVAGTQVAATCFAAVFIDKLGRRFLLLSSTIGMIGSIVTLGAYFWIQNTDPDEAEKIAFLPVASLSIYILAFSIGFGPIPWLMMSEIFAPEVKSIASSISASFNWTLCFVVAQAFQPMTKAFGTAAVFWGFGTFLTIELILCIIFVPETKGKSLDQIQDMFKRPIASRPDDEQEIINDTVEHVEEEEERDAVRGTVANVEDDLHEENAIVKTQ